MKADKSKILTFLNTVSGKAVLGIDGFIDEVWQVVDIRIDADTYEPMLRMKQFGDMIVERETGGFAKEIVRKRRTCGGFTCNTSRAVSRLGIETVMVGTFGDNEIDPVFDEFKDNKRFSIAAPVICSVLEFSDGKIMMPYIENLLKFDWPKLKSVLTKTGNIFEDANIVGIGYWSNMPDFDNMLTELVKNYIKEGTRLFFDFANVTKKSVQALKQTLSVMNTLNKKTPMTLSLNEHEGSLLFEYYHIKDTDPLNAVTTLRNKVGIEEIIVHTPHYATIATAKEGSLYAEQAHIQNPVRTAGAGDSFNGGYMASCLANLNPAERLSIASTVTCFYVTNGYPPDSNQLTEIVKQW